MNEDEEGKSVTTVEGERIAKVLARAGIASRRDAEKMIEAGRVSLNGTVLSSPAVNVTSADVVKVDGEPLPAPAPARLWRYHKPAGLVTTHKDPQGRPTVFEHLPPELPRVISIGRLDLNSEGLLLLTNDGDLARVLEHPDTAWVRRYRVRVYGTVEARKLETLAAGVTVEGIRYGPVKAEFERQQGGNAWVTVSLTEGKNREVRRLMEHLGYRVNRLIRVAYGPFVIGRLERGQVEEVPQKVLKDQLVGFGAAIPSELRREKGKVEKWAKAKPRPHKPNQRKPSAPHKETTESAAKKGSARGKGAETSARRRGAEAPAGRSTRDNRNGGRKG